MLYPIKAIPKIGMRKNFLLVITCKGCINNFSENLFQQGKDFLFLWVLPKKTVNGLHPCWFKEEHIKANKTAF